MARITTPPAWAALLATILVTVLAVVPTSTAQADTQFTATVLTAEGWDHADLYAGPGLTYAKAGTVAAGSTITLGCWIQGDRTTGPHGDTTGLWYTVVGTESYINDAMIWTGTDQPVTDPCGGMQESAPPTPIQYDRQKAVDWALANVNTPDRYVEDDCTWFVSQALWAGGIVKTTWWVDDPDFGPTRTVTVADELAEYLSSESGFATSTELSWTQSEPPGAQLGDIIAYDWEGDGTINHLAMVTGYDQDRFPLVSQHTPTQTNRYWSWSEQSHDWISIAHPGAKVFLIHITY